MLTLFVLPGLAASLEGGVMGVEPCGKHEGIRVFLLIPALVLGHASQLGRGLPYLKWYLYPVSG